MFALRWLGSWFSGPTAAATGSATTSQASSSVATPLVHFRDVLAKQEKQLDELYASFGTELAKVKKQRRSESPLPDVAEAMKKLKQEVAPHTAHILPKNSLETFLIEARTTLEPLHRALLQSSHDLQELLKNNTSANADAIRAAAEKLCKDGQHVAGTLDYYVNNIQRVMLSINTIEGIAGTLLNVLHTFLPVVRGPSAGDKEFADRIADTAISAPEQVEQAFTLKVITDLERMLGEVKQALEVTNDLSRRSPSPLQQQSQFAARSSSPATTPAALPRVHSSPTLA